MPKKGTISNPSIPTATAAATARCRTTSRPQASHGRLAELSRRSRGQSILGPMPPRMAGSNVVITATEISGMSMPPSPMLRSPGTGSTTRATRPMPTVSPENTTARPAVFIAAITAEVLSCPRARSSRHRVTTSSE